VAISTAYANAPIESVVFRLTVRYARKARAQARREWQVNRQGESHQQTDRNCVSRGKERHAEREKRHGFEGFEAVDPREDSSSRARDHLTVS